MPSSSGNTQRKLGIGVFLICALILLGGVAVNFPSASNQGYAPAQPIPFSHKIHAGDNKIACQYCHTSVEISRHATVPSMNVCMNCHTVVKTESPWIQQVQKLYKAGQTLEWVRVHELPDFVYFPHKRHVAKGVACEDCHGKVQEMETMYQFAPLTMGWCMDCHRGVTTPKNVLQNIYPGVQNPTGPVAAVNCNTCHY